MLACTGAPSLLESQTVATQDTRKVSGELGRVFDVGMPPDPVAPPHLEPGIDTVNLEGIIPQTNVCPPLCRAERVALRLQASVNIFITTEWHLHLEVNKLQGRLYCKQHLVITPQVL